ncbi:MAG: hypothetical protein J6T70_19590, partial [Bacteroidales bacterium]|nr:hypothetical protein [Bacteroidales bacterium]
IPYIPINQIDPLNNENLKKKLEQIQQQYTPPNSNNNNDSGLPPGCIIWIILGIITFIIALASK